MDEKSKIRINKYLSESGYCSRRMADSLVAEGRVMVDDHIATAGEQVSDGQIVQVDGNRIERATEHKIYAFYKPVGYISSLSDEQGEGISGFLTMKERVYPVGRLDKDSEGLMLLTNDGELMNQVLKASNGHEKEYEVTVDRKLTTDFLKKLEGGVEILNRATGERVITAPCRTRQMSDRTFSIVIIQGLNRQIRRMCGAYSYKVTKLKRVRIMGVTVGNLAPGELREVTRSEVGLEI